MLTPKEFEQLCTAIDCCSYHTINRTVSAGKIKLLISKYVEEAEKKK